jgi:hypothetical protein
MRLISWIPLGATTVLSIAFALRQPKVESCPAASQRLTKTELFFGLSKPNGAIVTETEFQAFVDAKVTPLFPDGLTLLSGKGQFKTAAGAIAQEPAKLLIVIHPEGNQQNAAIEQIRTAYRQRFQQESVLRTDDLVCVSL